jgi:hypothetical protein
MKRHRITDIVSGLLAFLLMYAAVSKLIGYTTFSIQLSQSPFITGFAKVIALVVPGIEICIAVMVALRGVRLLALYAALFLLSLFTAYIAAMLHYSYYIPCSCGGVLASLSWKKHLIFNTVFIIITLAGILWVANENNGKKLKTTAL